MELIIIITIVIVVGNGPEFPYARKPCICTRHRGVTDRIVVVNSEITNAYMRIEVGKHCDRDVSCVHLMKRYAFSVFICLNQTKK